MGRKPQALTLLGTIPPQASNFRSITSFRFSEPLLVDLEKGSHRLKKQKQKHTN